MISTLPALTGIRTGRFPAMPETATFRHFRPKAENQGALAYPSVKTCPDPSFAGIRAARDAWIRTPGPRIRGSGCPDPGSRMPGSGVKRDRIRAPGGLLEPSWEAQVRPARPPGPGWPRPTPTWMLSNTYPGSPGGDPGDRARSTVDTATLTVMLSSRTTSRRAERAPEPRGPFGGAALVRRTCWSVVACVPVAVVYPGLPPRVPNGMGFAHHSDIWGCPAHPTLHRPFVSAAKLHFLSPRRHPSGDDAASCIIPSSLCDVAAEAAPHPLRGALLGAALSQRVGNFLARPGGGRSYAPPLHRTLVQGSNRRLDGSSTFPPVGREGFSFRQRCCLPSRNT